MSETASFLAKEACGARGQWQSPLNARLAKRVAPAVSRIAVRDGEIS